MDRKIRWLNINFEAYDMFQAMIDAIQDDVVAIFTV